MRKNRYVILPVDFEEAWKVSAQCHSRDSRRRFQKTPCSCFSCCLSKFKLTLCFSFLLSLLSSVTMRLTSFVSRSSEHIDGHWLTWVPPLFDRPVIIVLKSKSCGQSCTSALTPLLSVLLYIVCISSGCQTLSACLFCFLSSVSIISCLVTYISSSSMWCRGSVSLEHRTMLQ